MKLSICLVSALLVASLTSCGPNISDPPFYPTDGGTTSDGGTTCVPVEFSCYDGQDNDCDGVLDCADPDCAKDQVSKARCEDAIQCDLTDTMAKNEPPSHAQTA